MPAKKRTYNRKRRIRRRRKTRKLPIGGFPKNKLVKMRYVTESVIQCSGLSSSHTFAANGLYDPDITGIGHQPKGFDQWMAVYNHFNVLGSKISVKLANTHGADNFIWGVTRTPLAAQMNGHTLTYCLENRYNRGYRTIGTSYNNSGVRALANISQTAKYSQKAQFGRNSTNKGDLTGNNGANPQEQQCFEIWIAPINNVPTSQTASFIVTIDYIALLTEPRILAQS